jgi:hypothetical protein
MNAVKDILEKANLMIDELIKKEDERLTDLKNDYIEWLDGEEHHIRKKIQYQVELINKRFNRDFKRSVELVGHRAEKKEYDKIGSDLYIAMDEKNKQPYFDLMRQTNLDKLKQAIVKHGITDDMKADDVELKSGKKGLEIHAGIDGKKFITFAVLAGGYIQRYHYRYRSSFK